jgi:hypothetical protein
MMEVAIQGVRLAVATLLARRGGGNDFEWDVAVVNLTDARGNRTEPRWSVYTVDPDPNCPVCKKEDAASFLVGWRAR